MLANWRKQQAHAERAALAPRKRGPKPAANLAEHRGRKETLYKFTDPDRLMTDFLTDVTRWNHENGRS